MGALERLERLIGALVERPAALLGSRRLHPRAVASAVTAAMEAAALPLADRVVIPDAYLVRLHPDDLARLGAAQRTLERELAAYIGRVAAERDLTLHAPPSVTLTGSTAVRPGAADATGHFLERETPRATRAGGPLTEVVSLPRRDPVSSGVTGVAAGVATVELLDGAGSVVMRRTLDRPSIIIGRRLSSDLPVNDPEVSRQHARITATPPAASIEDLESRNGTLVNGRAVAGRQPLADGDLIQVGQTRIRFRRG